MCLVRVGVGTNRAKTLDPGKSVFTVAARSRAATDAGERRRIIL